MERYNSNSNSKKSFRQHVSLFYCEGKSVQRQLRLILARSVKIFGLLGSQPLSSFLIVPQLGTLSLRPFALFNCLWKRHIMLDYKPRKSEALAAALGGASSVFFSHYIYYLGKWKLFQLLSPIPQAAEALPTSLGSSRSLVLSLSPCLLSLSALGRSFALRFQSFLSLVAAETRLACSVSIEVRFRSQQARDPLDKYEDIEGEEEA